MLNVAGDDLDTETLHVFLSLLLNLVTELLSVVAEVLQCDRTDDLSHVTLEGINEGICDLLFLHIEEVLHGELNAFTFAHDPYLCDGVDVYTDEVCCRYIAVGLDVDRDLLDQELVLSLEEGHLEACSTDKDLRVPAETRDDVGLVRRCLNIAADNDDDHNDRNDYCCNDRAC